MMPDELRSKREGPCVVEGCDEPMYARRMCGKHYARWRTHGSPTVVKTRMIDLLGRRFGRLVVLERAVNQSGRKVSWRVRCDCGQETVVGGEHLRSGHTTSCGCAKLSGKTRSEQRYRRYRYDAAYRGITFGLSLPEFGLLVSLACRYCAAVGEVGIDRIDNRLGYEPGNVVPCCSVCNRMKGTMTVEEFESHIANIHRNIRNPFIVQVRDAEAV